MQFVIFRLAFQFTVRSTCKSRSWSPKH